MTRLRWIALALVAVGGAYAAGRYTRPDRVVTLVAWRWLEVENRVVVRERVQTRHVETRTERQPSGAVITTRVEDRVTHSGSVARSERVDQGQAVQARVEEQRRASLALEVSGVWRGVQLAPDEWTAQAQVRVLGPLWLGAGVHHDEHGIAPVLGVRGEF